MSIIWCPVTDELNPGGLLRWERLGLVWESCCKFCNVDVREEDFPIALELLKERARLAYVATGGKYVEGAESPVEGAIRHPPDVLLFRDNTTKPHRHLVDDRGITQQHGLVAWAHLGAGDSHGRIPVVGWTGEPAPEDICLPCREFKQFRRLDQRPWTMSTGIFSGS